MWERPSFKSVLNNKKQIVGDIDIMENVKWKRSLGRTTKTYEFATAFLPDFQEERNHVEPMS